MKKLLVTLAFIGFMLFGCEKPEQIDPIIPPAPQFGYVNIINTNTNDSLSNCAVRIYWKNGSYNYVVDDNLIVKGDTGQLKITGYWTKWVYNPPTPGYWIEYFDTTEVTIINNDTVNCYLTTNK
jgi:hypothetical protein